MSIETTDFAFSIAHDFQDEQTSYIEQLNKRNDLACLLTGKIKESDIEFVTKGLIRFRTPKSLEEAKAILIAETVFVCVNWVGFARNMMNDEELHQIRQHDWEEVLFIPPFFEFKNSNRNHSG